MRKIETMSTANLLNPRTFQEEIISKERELSLMRKLNSFEGFYKFYWSQVRNFADTEKAFAYVNALYAQLFGSRFFVDYDAFLCLCYSNISLSWKA